jgi:hypothetical protein
MNLKACTIRLIESAKDRLELKAACGLSKSYLERGPLDDELATYYILKGEPVMIPDATREPHAMIFTNRCGAPGFLRHENPLDGLQLPLVSMLGRGIS